jgi:beta-lactamase class A
MEDRVRRTRATARCGVLFTLAVTTLLGAAPAPRPSAPRADWNVEAGTLAPQERVLWEQLAARVAALESGLDGVLALAVKDLRSGATLELRADQELATASVIKVALLYELYRQADEGRVDLAELTGPPLPRTGGGGVLQELGDQVRLTWRDLAVLTAGWSDNTATNMLIERVGLGAVDTRLRALGLGHTRLRRRMLDLDAARRGDENVSSARELARLMELIQRGEGLGGERARDLRAVLAVPKVSPFREVLPEGLTVVDKPGELEGLRTLAALVERPERPYVVAILCGYLQRDSDGDEVIRRLSQVIFETEDRLARASAYGRLLGAGVQAP